MTALKRTPICIEVPPPGYILIKLTKGYETAIDLEDADLAEFNWSVKAGKVGRVYAQRRVGNTTEPLHVVILERVIQRALHPSERADHIDNDSLNNLRCNLRVATHAQNIQNSRKHINANSKYKGVCFHRQLGKFQAQIRVDGKQLHLGLFDTAELAHAAYCEAAKEHYGSFARFS